MPNIAKGHMRKVYLLLLKGKLEDTNVPSVKLVVRAFGNHLLNFSTWKNVAKAIGCQNGEIIAMTIMSSSIFSGFEVSRSSVCMDGVFYPVLTERKREGKRQ